MGEHPQDDAIWADEGGLQLTLTHMTHNRIVVAIVDAVNDRQLAAVTIANYRVGRIAAFASAVASLHEKRMMDAEEAKCKTCGTKVIHAKDSVGQKIILDARRHPIYVLSPTGDVWVRADGARLSHFVTCPQATQHSKKKSV